MAIAAHATAETKATAKSLAHAQSKKSRQQNVPKAKLHNVILCNSSIFKGVRGALHHLRDCISTLCKIAAHGASQLCASHSVRSRRKPQA
jgi:hypothetical protein